MPQNGDVNKTQRDDSIQSFDINVVELDIKPSLHKLS